MMTAIVRSLQAEIFKLRRTLALRMVILAPLLVALLSFFAQLAAFMAGRGDPPATFWLSLWRNSLLFWILFLLPLLITVETTLLANLEHGEKLWKHTFALPVPRSAIFFAKFVVAQTLAVLSTLVLCALIVLSGWALIATHPALASAGMPPIGAILSLAIQCWLASGLVLSISLWIALRWPGFTVPFGVGIAGTFFALFASSAKVAAYYPWLLALNVFSENEHATTAAFIGIAGGIVAAVLGCIDFCRREESAPPQLSRAGRTVLIAILLAFCGFAAYLDRQSLWRPRTHYTRRFVTVDPGVALEVLDWGGSGRPVVLLSALGDTAHVFEGFAPMLARRYHVYAITRRGFGASSHPAYGYGADQLGDDVLKVLDALNVTRPVVVGHSIGGEEVSSIGTRYPEKVAGLVYLDAAYPYAYYDRDRGDFTIDLFALDEKIQKLKPGSGAGDTTAVMQELIDSLPGIDRVLRRQVDELRLLRDDTRPATSGLNRVGKPGFAAARAIVAGERKYGATHVPVLAIFAFPPAEARNMTVRTGPQIRAFEHAMPSARVVKIPASHYIFQSNETDVLREMNAFIANLPR
jgi:pimeloyl-ACP methyl ester carboxylesterase